jgi:hypothetical protein
MANENDKSPPLGRVERSTAEPTSGDIREPTLTLTQTLVGIGVVYAALTVISSAFALIAGGRTETHVHLLLRFGVTTIGTGAFYAYGLLRRRLTELPSALTGLVTYIVALLATLAGVWLYGRVDVLHPDAYRDIFLNFTAVAGVLSAIWAVATRLLRRGSPDTASVGSTPAPSAFDGGRS